MAAPPPTPAAADAGGAPLASPSLLASVASSAAPDATRAAPRARGPLLGISLTGLHEVIAAAGGRAALAGRTTDWLKAHVVIPRTAAAGAACVAPCAAGAGCSAAFWQHTVAHTSGCGVSFADVLRERAAAAEGPALVGAATVFLSHAYDYLFLDVVDAAEAWQERAAGAGAGTSAPHYFYIDLLVVNQHGQNGIVSFEALRDEFGGGVGAVGHTLLLLDWANPHSLARAWCIFEIGVSLEVGARFEVIMPARDEAAFAAALVDDFDSLALKAGAVDAAAARAFSAADREHILRYMQEHLGGCLRVDQLVIGALREWMAGAGRGALARLPPGARAGSSLAAGLAGLLRDQGQYDEAEALCRGALAARRGALGPAHVATLSAAHQLSALLLYRRAYAEAEALGREALAGRRSALGDAHDATLASAANLANVLRDQGKLDEAEPLLHEALAGARAAHGEAHQSTRAATNNLALFYKAAGKFALAEPLYRSSLASHREALGPAHPLTLSATFSLANLLLSLRQLDEAEPLFSAALEGRRRVLGEAHSETLNALNALAMLLYLRGRFGEAEPHFRAVLAGTRAALGADHPRAIDAVENLAGVLDSLGRHAEAEPLFREALATNRRVLGDAHAATKRVRADFAAFLTARGRAGEAGEV